MDVYTCNLLRSELRFYTILQFENGITRGKIISDAIRFLIYDCVGC